MTWETIIDAAVPSVGSNTSEVFGGIAVYNGDVYVIVANNFFRWGGSSWIQLGSGHGGGRGLTHSARSSYFYYYYTSTSIWSNREDGNWESGVGDPGGLGDGRALAAEGEYLYSLSIDTTLNTNRIRRATVALSDDRTTSAWSDVLDIDDGHTYGGMAVRGNLAYLVRRTSVDAGPIRVYNLDDGEYFDIGPDVDGYGLAFDGDDLLLFSSRSTVERFADFPDHVFIDENDDWREISLFEGMPPAEYPGTINGDSSFRIDAVAIYDGDVYLGVSSSTAILLRLQSDGSWDVVHTSSWNAYGMTANDDGIVYIGVNGSLTQLVQWSEDDGAVTSQPVDNRHAIADIRALAYDKFGNSPHDYYIVGTSSARDISALDGELDHTNIVSGWTRVADNDSGNNHALAVAGDGRLLATDGENRLVARAADGTGAWERLTESGIPEDPDGPIARVRGLAVDEDGYVYATGGNQSQWKVYRTRERVAAPPPVVPEHRARETGEDTYFALEITHTDLENPVRVVADNQAHNIEGNEYMALAFRAIPPNFQEGEQPQAVLEIDNVGRALMDVVETTSGGRGAKMRVMQVRRAKREGGDDDILWELPALPVGVTSVSNDKVQLTLAYRSGRHRPGVKWRHTQEVSPGLF